MRQLKAVIAFSLLAATAARAEVTIFDNEADFLAAAPIVATQTFEDLPDMQTRLQIEVDNLVFTTRGIWQLPGTCSLERTLGANNIGRRHITFVGPNGGPTAVNAVGFSVTTFAIFPPADYAVGVVTLDGVFTTDLIDDAVNGEPAYRGFISTSPITQVMIQAVGTTQFNFCMDDVSHSAVLSGEAGAVVDPDALETDDAFKMYE